MLSQCETPFLGTPRGGSLSASGGGMVTFGASRNEYLKGFDAYYGGAVAADVFAELGVEMVCSTGLDYVDANDSGKLDLYDDLILQVDPNSGRHITSLQAGVSTGVNGVPNGLEAGGAGGLSVAQGFNIIPGWHWRWWPWNWGR
jgi:hypothetical protein